MHTPVIPALRVAALRAAAVGWLLFAGALPGGTTTLEATAQWNAVLARHVHRGTVAYTAIKADTSFARAVENFSSADPAALTASNDRLAFWINAYNAFTVQLIVEHLPLKSINEVGKTPWDDRFITVHGKRYSLNAIEHEIIRNDFSEPRVHFALVCAAKGCPPLRSEAYRGPTLDRQLEENAHAFLADASKNRYDAATNTLYLSPIFDWYKQDFIARAGSVQAFVRPYFPGNGITANTAIRYTEYDWSLNGK